MELKHYLKILEKRWWIIVAAFLVTLIPTVMLVLRQPWIYESTASFVIRPRASFASNEEEFVKAVDTLSRRVEINTTFAEVADSSLIKRRALENLDLSSKERKGLKVNGKVKAGTNVLEIVAQGQNPQAVKDFAEEVSLETKKYVSGLYDVFELEPLDAADVPNSPVSPNKPLNIALGGFFGLLLGVSVVFLLEYLEEPVSLDVGFNILDPHTGVYNSPYLELRVNQELSRASRDKYEFSLALVKLNQRNRVSGTSYPLSPERAATQLSNAIDSVLRVEDVLAYLGDSTFALLLPNRSGEETKSMLENRKIKLNSVKPETLGSEVGTTLSSSIGIITYQDNQASAQELLAWASNALKEADKDPHGKVILYVPAEMDLTSLSEEDGSHQVNGDRHDREAQIPGTVSFRKVSS